MTAQQFEAQKIRERKQRIADLRSYRNKLVKAMRALDPKAASFAEITSGLKMISDQLRLEFRALDVSPAERPPATDDAFTPPAADDNPFAGVVKLKLHQPTQDVA